MKVLIVDDEKQIADMLSDFLKVANFDSEKSYGISDAINKFDNTFDVAIIDRYLQDGDGIHLVNKLKETKPSLNVIIMSGGGNKFFSDINTMLSAGINSILFKPFTRDQLFEQLNKFHIYNYTNEDKLKFIQNIIDMANTSSDILNVIKNIVHMIKDFMKVDVAGLRLKHMNDYPYFTSKGFPKDFIKEEMSLCPNNQKFDKDPILDCMCGSIIQRKLSSDLPYITDYGSFFTGNVTNLSKEFSKEKFRDVCIKYGYETVVLIPLKENEITYGLLQINDKRVNALNLKDIQFLEDVSKCICIAVSRAILEIKESKLYELQGSLLNLSKIFHELNQPIMILLGISSLIKEPKDVNDKKINDIKNASTRLMFSSKKITHILSDKSYEVKEFFDSGLMLTNKDQEK